jgi:hypothetical protein
MHAARRQRSACAHRPRQSDEPRPEAGRSTARSQSTRKCKSVYFSVFRFFSFLQFLQLFGSFFQKRRSTAERAAGAKAGVTAHDSHPPRRPELRNGLHALVVARLRLRPGTDYRKVIAPFMNERFEVFGWRTR